MFSYIVLWIQFLVHGKPDNFDGTEAAWPGWSIVMRAYAGAISMDMLKGMEAAEKELVALNNESMHRTAPSNLALFMHTVCSAPSSFK